MKYCFLVGLLVITTVLFAVQPPQIIDINSQIQGNQRDFGSRVNYNHYWMKYLPANYIDYNAANEFQYSEENQYDWDNGWILVSSADFTYVNNLVTQLYGEFGTMQAQSEVTYDANDRIYQIVLSLNTGSGFAIFMRETFEYNDNGILNSYLKELNSSGNWVNSEQTVITLDGDQTINILDQNWEDGSQTWINDEQFTLYWTGYLDAVATIVREDWEVDHWDDSMMYNYAYLDNMLIESLTQYWDGSNWIDSQNRFFTWDGDLIINELMKVSWNGWEWEDEMNQAFTFDDFDRPLELMGTVWNNDQWENDHWIEYIYNTGNSNNTIPDNSIKLSNYPNPFNPATTIKFSLQQGETGTLEIFNLKGQIILTQEFVSGDHTYIWNAADQSSGMYFYNISTSSYQQTGKMIMLK